MARLYCTQCGNPLPRRATECMTCETPVLQDAIVPQNVPKSLAMKCAIVCVALCCLGFVVVLGVTSLFTEGGLLPGGVFLCGILLSVRWVSSLEKKALCREDDV